MPASVTCRKLNILVSVNANWWTCLQTTKIHVANLNFDYWNENHRFTKLPSASNMPHGDQKSWIISLYAGTARRRTLSVWLFIYAANKVHDNSLPGTLPTDTNSWSPLVSIAIPNNCVYLISLLRVHVR
jgi:hypothetical protein